MVVFAITGTLSRPRAQIVADINRAGHTVATSLTKAVQYLVQGASNRANDSIKASKAANAGIKVISESQLMRMLNGGAAPSSKRTPARAPRAKKAATASPATRAQQQRLASRVSQAASQSYAPPSNRRSANLAKQSASRSTAAIQQKKLRPADSPNNKRRYPAPSTHPTSESYVRNHITGRHIQDGTEFIRGAIGTLSSLMQSQFDAIKPVYSDLSRAMQLWGSALREVGDRSPIPRVAAQRLPPLSILQNISMGAHFGKKSFDREAASLIEGGRTGENVLNKLMQVSGATKKLADANYHLAHAMRILDEEYLKAPPRSNSKSASQFESSTVRSCMYM